MNPYEKMSIKEMQERLEVLALEAVEQQALMKWKTKMTKFFFLSMCAMTVTNLLMALALHQKALPLSITLPVTCLSLSFGFLAVVVRAWAMWQKTLPSGKLMRWALPS